GGATKSYLVRGRAADISVKGKSPENVHAYLDGKNPTQYGLGKNKTFTQIDSRSKKSRWNGKSSIHK
uniref:D-Ala-D-Ala carboxypeptidase family metallohydrolase n=1 Tax=Escherichia coli TaxID=562 RepID=UPI00207B9110